MLLWRGTGGELPLYTIPTIVGIVYVVPREKTCVWITD